MALCNARNVVASQSMDVWIGDFSTSSSEITEHKETEKKKKKKKKMKKTQQKKKKKKNKKKKKTKKTGCDETPPYLGAWRGGRWRTVIGGNRMAGCLLCAEARG